MADESAPSSTASTTPESSPEKRREIKGGLPYSVYPTAFKKALDAIIVAERPDRLSGDFVSTVLKVSGGSARPIPPMLKKMNFITSDGTPTDLYSKFKTDTARGQAALDGLRNAYGEMFRRNEFIHRAEPNVVKDLIVEITGLKKNDKIVNLIDKTFEVIRGYADKNSTPASDTTNIAESDADENGNASISYTGMGPLGLSYHINVVLPETENIAVFNAIFRSLRENLLR